MNHLYGRIKRLRNEPFRKIVSGKRAFDDEIPADSVRVAYDPSTSLEDGDWFQILNFREKEFFPQALEFLSNTADVAELEKGQFSKISALVSVQDGNQFLQRVRPSSFLRRKAIVYGDVAKIEEAHDRIVLNQWPDAIYLPKEDALLFRDLATVAPLFPGIDQLFKVATDDQVIEFFDNSFIETELTADMVSQPNRKRIALAMKTLENISATDRSEIFDYLSEYTNDNLKFDSSTGTFTVDTDEALKSLLFGIEQRYYTTPIGSEKRLANSIVKLSS